MGHIFSLCCPPPEDDAGDASESSPLLGRANDPRRAQAVEVDEAYPRDDQQSKLDKIVRKTACAFVDINSERDVSITVSRDQGNAYQSALASLPDNTTATGAVLPNVAEPPGEVLMRTCVTHADVQRIEHAAQTANANLEGFRIEVGENLVEDFNNTPK